MEHEAAGLLHSQLFPSIPFRPRHIWNMPLHEKLDLPLTRGLNIALMVRYSLRDLEIPRSVLFCGLDHNLEFQLSPDRWWSVGELYRIMENIQSHTRMPISEWRNVTGSIYSHPAAGKYRLAAAALPLGFLYRLFVPSQHRAFNKYSEMAVLAHSQDTNQSRTLYAVRIDPDFVRISIGNQGNYYAGILQRIPLIQTNTQAQVNILADQAVLQNIIEKSYAMRYDESGPGIYADGRHIAQKGTLELGRGFVPGFTENARGTLAKVIDPLVKKGQPYLVPETVYNADFMLIDVKYPRPKLLERLKNPWKYLFGRWQRTHEILEQEAKKYEMLARQYEREKIAAEAQADERNLARLTERLLQAESAGTMSRAAFHDLANRASATGGSLSLLKKSLEQNRRPRELESLVEDAIASHEEGTGIIESMLKRSSSSTQRQEIRLDMHIRNLIDSAHLYNLDYRQNRQKYSVRAALGPVEAYVDPLDVTFLFLNLWNNAVHATLGRESPRIHVALRKAEGGIYLHVMDNGTGVKGEVLRRLYEDMVSTKDSHGLGLVYVRKIAEKYNGRVLPVATKPGRYTKMSVIINPDRKAY